MDFNYSIGLQAPGAPNPDMDVFYYQKAPRIQAQGNLTLLQYMDLLEFLWKGGYPEIIFQPMGAKKEFNPERAYIIWELDNRVPKDNNAKPRYQETYDHPTDPNRKIAIWTQSFNNFVSFTVIHMNPRTAEEIMEQFELFMFQATPIFKQFGLEEFLYGRRVSDHTEKRYGEDMSAKTIVYMVTTQTVIPIDQNKLREVVGAVRIFLNGSSDEIEPEDEDEEETEEPGTPIVVIIGQVGEDD